MPKPPRIEPKPTLPKPTSTAASGSTQHADAKTTDNHPSFSDLTLSSPRLSLRSLPRLSKFEFTAYNGAKRRKLQTRRCSTGIQPSRLETECPARMTAIVARSCSKVMLRLRNSRWHKTHAFRPRFATRPSKGGVATGGNDLALVNAISGGKAATPCRSVTRHY